MKNWYNVETMFVTLADALSNYLKSKNIYYERSGCFGGYHFEIYATKKEAENIDAWLLKDAIIAQ